MFAVPVDTAAARQPSGNARNSQDIIARGTLALQAQEELAAAVIIVLVISSNFVFLEKLVEWELVRSSSDGFSPPSPKTPSQIEARGRSKKNPPSLG